MKITIITTKLCETPRTCSVTLAERSLLKLHGLVPGTTARQMSVAPARARDRVWGTLVDSTPSSTSLPRSISQVKNVYSTYDQEPSKHDGSGRGKVSRELQEKVSTQHSLVDRGCADAGSIRCADPGFPCQLLMCWSVNSGVSPEVCLNGTTTTV